MPPALVLPLLGWYLCRFRFRYDHRQRSGHCTWRCVDLTGSVHVSTTSIPSGRAAAATEDSNVATCAFTCSAGSSTQQSGILRRVEDRRPARRKGGSAVSSTPQASSCASAATDVLSLPARGDAPSIALGLIWLTAREWDRLPRSQTRPERYEPRRRRGSRSASMACSTPTGAGYASPGRRSGQAGQHRPDSSSPERAGARQSTLSLDAKTTPCLERDNTTAGRVRPSTPMTDDALPPWTRQQAGPTSRWCHGGRLVPWRSAGAMAVGKPRDS